MKNQLFLEAWLSGDTIQVHLGEDWYSIPPINSCTDTPYHFSDDYTLRIKPKAFTSTTYIQRKHTNDKSPLHLVDSYTEHPNIELTWEDNILISAKVL